jgi:NTE family protein
VFPPVSHEGKLLVDGAVAAFSPIAVATRLGARRLIVLPCGFACANTRVATSALGRAMHAITLLGARQLRQDFEHYHQTVAIHIVPPLCPLQQSSFDYSRGRELIERGRTSTRAWIAGGGLQNNEFPHQLTEHSHAA